jgi:hypothetical protein
MKRNRKLIAVTFLMVLIPFAVAAGQEKKSEQRIKIVIEDEGGSNVILDTLITGKPLSDSIVLKNGQTVYLVQDGSDNVPGAPGTKKYVITASASEGSDSGKKINKEITIISSDSDISEGKENEMCKHVSCGSPGTRKTYSYTIQSEDSKDTDTEKTKYVIARDGVVITVEGSDYDKVKVLIKEIEKTLDGINQMK